MKYIKAPVTNLEMYEEIRERRGLPKYPLRKCIELLGMNCQGKGSYYSRGKKYLRMRYGYSGMEIKRMYHFYDCILVSREDLTDLGDKWYKISNRADRILAAIIDEITNKDLAGQLADVLSQYNHGEKYLDILFEKQYKGLRYTADFLAERDDRFEGVSREARKLCEGLQDITQEY